MSNLKPRRLPMERVPSVASRAVALLWLFIVLSPFQALGQNSFSSIAIVPDEPMTVNYGDSPSLSCIAVSSSINETTVTVDWNSTALSPNISSQSVAILVSTHVNTVVGTLDLVNVDSGYCGDYICEVADVGIAPASETTSIYVVPIIETSPVSEIVVVAADSDSTNVTFSCTANGGIGDMVDITWDGPSTVDMESLMNYTSTIDNSDGTFTSVLTITGVTGDSAGDYRCNAGYSNPLCNMETVSSDSATLTVIEPPEYIEFPPPLMTVNSGSNVTIACSISALTEHTNSTFEAPEAVSSDSISMVTTSTSITYTVTLTNIDYTMGGVYTCSAGNIAGNITNSSILYIRPTIIPPSVLTQVNETRMLVCAVQEDPVPSYRWRKMEDDTMGMLFELFSGSGGSGMNVFAQRVLVLDPVVFGDEGSYMCEVDTQVTGLLMSDITIVTVSPNSSVQVTPQTMMISNRGNDVIFTCSAEGGPDNTFQWLKNDDIIVNETEEMLFLTNITAADGGEYTCVVSNAAGNDSDSSTLYLRPYFITEPVDEIRTTVGENVSFVCVAEGFPSPSVSWEWVNEANMSMFMQVANGSMLSFMPVVFGDEGSYRCVVEAMIPGEMTMMLTPGSLSTLHVSPAGSVAVSPNVSISNRSDDVTFTCSAKGGPDNTFQWMKDDDILVNETEQMLTLTDVAASNGGEYTCVVSNAAGNDSDSSTLYLRPYFTTEPVDEIRTSFGESVNFTCEADGFPIPSISWWRVETDTQVANTSILLFDSIDYSDAGIYRCVTSAMLSDELALTATVEPSSTLYVSPFGSVMVTPQSSIRENRNNVTFTCSAEGGPDNTFQWMKDQNILVNETEDTLTLTNVAASDGGEYTCTVSNPAGNGSDSSTLYIRPYFTTIPRSEERTNINENVTFICEAEGFPAPSISWLKLNPNLTVIEEVSNVSVLIFEPVQFGDEGNYVCVATSLTSNGTDLTEMYQPHSVLVVSPRGSVSLMPELAVVANGNDVTFTCSAEGGPDNTFQWLKDDDILVNETEQMLTLTDVAASNGGDYTCTVSNRAGNDSTSSTLNVQPYIVTQPEVDVRVTDQTSVTLSCEAESFPSPSYIWEKLNSTSGGFEMVSGDRVFEFTAVFGDEGVYRCVASIRADMTDYSAESDTTTLTISPEGSVEVMPLEVSRQEGEIAMFMCNANGGPGNTFTWTRLYDNMVVGNYSALNVSVENAFDGGEYQCSVENTAGSESRMVTLNVHPVLVEFPTALNVTLAEGIMLSCNATGFPLPSIQWYHNGTLVIEDDRVNISESTDSRSTLSTLTVSVAMTNDSGDYQCNASNTAGSDTSDSVTVLVQNRPEQPQNVTAVMVNSRSIVLQWVEPHDNNAPIFGYRVFYQQPMFAGGDNEQVNSSMEMANITDLLPGVDYSFTVEAFNDIGESVPSEPLTVRTSDEVPTSPPVNVTTMALSSTSIMVSWDEVPAIDRNGLIVNYEVLYEPLETFEGAIQSMTVNVSNTFTMLTDLQEFVNYNISVRAYTSQGPGPYSDDITEMTLEDAPNAAPNNVTAMVLTSTSIMVSWEEVTPIERNGIITMYKVLYEPLETFEGAIQSMTVNTTDTSVTLSGLEEFVNYNISVRAYTSEGPGPYSEDITEMTLQDAPNASPVNVSTMAQSSTSIMVSWDEVPAIDRNGLIVNYEVLYEPLETFEGAIQSMTLNVSNTSVTLSGLQEFVNYNISVRAYTSEGPGPYSEDITEMTLEDAPNAAPNNVTAMVLTSTSIMVSWEEVTPIDRNGIITDYEVLYEPLETFGGAIMSMTVNTTNTYVTLSGLEEFVNYSISVRAYTSEGPGPYSDEITEMTLQDAPNAAPVNVSTMAQSSTSIMVSWDEVPAIDRNGLIVNYEVLYEPLETFGEAIGSMTVNTTDTSFTLSGLEEFVNYNISVRAYTSEGPGPYSEEITEMTLEDVPASPPDNVNATVLSSTSIMVSWDEVPAIDRNGIIILYEVLYEPLETFGEQIEANVSTTTELSLTLEGLEEFVNYNISVRAYTSEGPGPYSDKITRRTNEDVPASPPDNVTANSTSSTSIFVSWDEVPAIDRNGIIILYEVLYEPLETFGDQIEANVSNTTELSLNLEGLEEFVNYSISVRAYTSEGPGPYSEDITEMTLQDVPGAPPTDVVAMVISSTEVNITWVGLNESDFNGILTMYRVDFVTSDGEMEDFIDVDDVDNTTFFLDLIDLEEFTTYNITVTAYTGVGPGPASEPVVIIMTLQDIPGTPAPPEVPSNETITPFSATLSWAPPPDANGVILNYTVNLVAVMFLGGSEAPVGRRKRQLMEESNQLDACVVGGMDNLDRNITVDGQTTLLVIINLTPYTVYEYRVQAVTIVGVGSFSAPTGFSTPEDVPSKPLNLTVTTLTSTSLQVSWMPPSCNYGVLTNYTIDYTPVESDGSTGDPPPGYSNITVDTTSLIITGLTPNTGYMVNMAASTMSGLGDVANTTGMTEEDAPQAIGNLSLTSEQSSSNSNAVQVTISWVGPSARNGSYNYTLILSATQSSPYPPERDQDSSLQLVLSGEQLNVDYIIEEGLPFAVYDVEVTAVNIATDRAGPTTMLQNQRTIAIPPSPVIFLTTVASSPVSIFVSWDLPKYPNGKIIRYNIYYRQSNTNSTPPTISSDEYQMLMTSAMNRTINITGLTAFTNYTVAVQAVGQDAEGAELLGMVVEEWLERTNATVVVIAQPTPGTTVEPTLPPSQTTIDYDLPVFDFNTGPLLRYAVIVFRTTNTFDSTEVPDLPNLRPFDPNDITQTYYIAAAWDNAESIPSRIKIGDGSITTASGVNYTNAPLKPGTEYAVFSMVEIVSDNNQPLVTFSPVIVAQTEVRLGYNPGGLGFGIVLILLVIAGAVIAVVLGLYWYRTRYYMPKREGYADNDLEFEEPSAELTAAHVYPNPAAIAKPYAGTMEPLTLEEFKDHVKRMHANDDYLFSEEYCNVEPNHAPSTEATRNPHNAVKNRYANISAYDHSRVMLLDIPNKPGSDYINGNFINGYHQVNAFIATQGPVPDSVPDFWRMVWEQGTATIVMLTNLEEKGRVKCHQYWPTDKSDVYGSIRVHIQEVLVLADYTVRTFSLCKDSSKEERIVIQYHFTSWPDHGVPVYPTTLLHFVRKVAVSNPTNAGPMVVHCSAGVGRTGTFITLICQLKRIINEQTIDVFSFVRSMRYNRCYMVQTEPQYIFIHDALLEAIECGVTEVAARDLQQQYKKLGVVDDEVGLTGLEIEFDKLDISIHRRMTRSSGTLQINKPKNRYANIDMIPFDTSRCRLSFIPGVEGSDYINATHIDGYHKRRAFIATQGPLPDTTDDFWRMIWEKSCATIVMLTKEREGGRVKCHRYWPESGASTFRQFQVILHSVNEYPDYTLREFKIVDTKDGSSLPVKQFQYTGWPEEGVPDTGSGLIDLIGQVQKWQRSSGDKPIIVHCSGGAGRTGTFIANSILLERLKTEGVVDVFHTARALRLQRPGMIQTVDQYEFCYKTVLEYLESFELYANFK